MVDKVQKIRKEVERIQLYTQSEVLKQVLDYIDEVQKEPVNEDFEKTFISMVNATHENNGSYSFHDFAQRLYNIAKEEVLKEFEKNRLKHCNSITNEQAELEQGFIDQHLDKYQRMPTFLDAIEYGMRLQKEKMMANAIDAVVHIEAGNYPYIPQIELYDYNKDEPLAKEGDKYKVILIKED